MLFLPGGIVPAEISYLPLVDVIKGRIRPIFKNLEWYRWDKTQEYNVEAEVQAIKRIADEESLENLDLVGYSAGGAICLAFSACYSERVRTMALVEPGWMGSIDLLPQAIPFYQEMNVVAKLPPRERISRFFQLFVQPDVQLPKASASLEALLSKDPPALPIFQPAWHTYGLDKRKLSRLAQPLYYAYGGLSNKLWEEWGTVLASLIERTRIEKYDGLHHFKPPHIVGTERFANALFALWF